MAGELVVYRFYIVAWRRALTARAPALEKLLCLDGTFGPELFSKNRFRSLSTCHTLPSSLGSLKCCFASTYAAHRQKEWKKTAAGDSPWALLALMSKFSLMILFSLVRDSLRQVAWTSNRQQPVAEAFSLVDQAGYILGATAWRAFPCATFLSWASRTALLRRTLLLSHLHGPSNQTST